MSSRNSTDRFRAGVMWCVLGGLFVFAGYSQARVQVIDRKEIIKKAIDTNRYEFERDTPARRGTIKSSDGKVLAQSRDGYEFGIDFRRCPKTPAFFLALAKATGMSQAELMDPALRGVSTRYWNEPVSYDMALDIREVKSDWAADGISLRPILSRMYPLADATAGIIGAVQNNEPKTGLEISQDDVLTGRDGWAKGYVDRTGVFMPLKGVDIVEQINGKDVTLTIDSGLQMEAAQAIRAAVEKHKATSGSAVMIDPKTGRILAMANWPTYDPEGPIVNDLNTAYMTFYEPGSTFKTLVLAKALDEGAVNPDSIMHCSGAITANRRTMRCHDNHVHGDINLGEAIAKSCNVAAAQWALGIGHDPMVEYLKGLGFLEKPGLGLPGEIKGLYNFDEYAKDLQLANNGFGQAMNMTPVALADAFSLLANGGIRMKPQIIQKIGSQEFPPVEAGRIVSENSANYVLNVMKETIEADYGTGHALRIPGYTLAGKTGTAQKIAGGQEKGYVASFVGFVPADQPKAVILVMVDDPKGGVYYGGSVAGPVFHDLAKAVIRKYGIAANEPGQPKQDAVDSGREPDEAQ